MDIGVLVAALACFQNDDPYTFVDGRFEGEGDHRTLRNKRPETLSVDAVGGLLGSYVTTDYPDGRPVGHRRPTASKKGYGMKIRHPLFVGLVAAFTVSLAIVGVSAVAADTPFKGTVSAVETGVTVFPIRTIDREGTGTATYLGKYTEHVTMHINVLTMHGIGSATFTAANGDTLSASDDGQATRTGPTTLSIVEVYTITGGTGRFADATGTFTLESTVDQTTGVSSGTFSGAIDH